MAGDEVVQIERSGSGAVERITRPLDGSELVVRQVLHHWSNRRGTDVYVTESFRLLVAEPHREPFEVTLMQFGRAPQRAWHMRQAG